MKKRPMRRRGAKPEAVVEGRPEIVVRPDDEEILADLVADMLLADVVEEEENRTERRR